MGFFDQNISYVPCGAGINFAPHEVYERISSAPHGVLAGLWWPLHIKALQCPASAGGIGDWDSIKIQCRTPVP